ncbi:unnamed protein product [Rhizoctonia solani]|uniref:Uncharacterized protein n=1 Tax=Rhizoctonia solani TaxID=456999 RepID=A0A8H3GQ61_9AGAM|nr:unnamed protein product [Rhizoctonia solani]
MPPAAMTSVAAAAPLPAALKAAAPATQFDAVVLFGAGKAACKEASEVLALLLYLVLDLCMCCNLCALQEGAGKHFKLFASNSLLKTFADKIPAVCTAALNTTCSLLQITNPWAVALILSVLHQIKTASKWQVKMGLLAILNQLIQSAPNQLVKLLPKIIPILAKANIKKAACKTLTKATAFVPNKDIDKFIPALINALIGPVKEVPKTIQLLLATTFISEVDAPTLLLMVPLLSCGLNECLTASAKKVLLHSSYVELCSTVALIDKPPICR